MPLYPNEITIHTLWGYRNHFAYNPPSDNPVPRTGIMATMTTTATRGAVHGYTMDKDDYVKRLKRIEGQVRGLQRMIDEDTYCIDILTQVSAVTKALQSVAVRLLDQHVRHCVSNAVAADSDRMVTEATRAIERLIRS